MCIFCNLPPQQNIQYTNMNQAQQRNTQDIVSHLMTGGNPRLRMPHLILEVSRENIVHDTGTFTFRTCPTTLLNLFFSSTN